MAATVGKNPTGSKKPLSRVRILLAVLLLALAGYFFLSPHGFYRLWRLESRRQSLQNEIDTLEKKLEDTRREIEKLKQDKTYLEKMAREKLGMAKPGEKVYKFVEEKGTSR